MVLSLRQSRTVRTEPSIISTRHTSIRHIDQTTCGPDENSNSIFLGRFFKIKIYRDFEQVVKKVKYVAAQEPHRANRTNEGRILELHLSDGTKQNLNENRSDLKCCFLLWENLKCLNGNEEHRQNTILVTDRH